ncbi:7-carboxy-7-deazaguanine synthase [Marinobacterium zhoushanense]|uniref:7-carboxy-7-deazaguanine synthase n=1 Tax=Marinobacterium zhoushanense TaxID=1679163 RepID=UPI00166C107C|nr:7-carboxy-7-deazaguanine synthase [Marinobacterium zhoushanense]
MYSVKEIFYSLQGEGTHAGRSSVFCRFSGCNLWSGREQDRHKAICNFCDTDFVGTDGNGGGKFASADELAIAVRAYWPAESHDVPYVICTGGEPLLQLDEVLVAAFHRQGFEVAIETNGTLPAPEGIDWICVSPKGSSEIVLTTGDELKLVYPQPDARPERFNNLNFSRFYLQPMAQPGSTDLIATTSTTEALDYCLKNPQWRLSLQMHKYLGIE